MTDILHGRHVVVTGGGGGLGGVIAAAFAAEGATLTLMGRTQATLDARADVLRRTFGIRVEGVVADVTDAASVACAFETAVLRGGPVHILINGAGHATAAMFQETTLTEWQQTIDVNLTGTFLCIQQVLPAMLAAGHGRIVNIASTAGLRGYTRVAAYCAAKHGVVGLTRALAAETTRSGITANAVCPGYIEGTPMLRSAIANVVHLTGKSEDEARALLARPSPDGTFVTMDDVAAKVLWLCSAEASTTTGQAITFGAGEALGPGRPGPYDSHD
jgi:NAD(P)-dependent dehydrogenase (short-subunit alcohol dehydrogenase family)